MPRNSSGVYSLPSVYFAVADTDIVPEQHNTPLEDIAGEITKSVAVDGRTPMTGELRLSGDPTVPLGAVPKQYADLHTAAVLTTLAAHTGNSSNPHSVTAAQVGLGNVDNTSDADKPVSTATATALALKLAITDAPAAVRSTVLTGLSTATSAVIAAADTVLSALGKIQAQITTNLATLTAHTGSTSNPHSVTKAQVGLGSVENLGPLDLPVSTAQAAEIATRAPMTHVGSTDGHPVATVTTAGMMSAVDKSRADWLWTYGGWRAVTIEMFAGTSAASVGNGIIDETTWFESACQAAMAFAGRVVITPGKHRITSKRTYNAPFEIVGVGAPSPYKILADNTNLLSVAPADYYKGPWLYFDHTDVGLEFYGADGPMGQARVSGIGITRPQTVPVTGTPFVPINQGWDLVISNAWATISDVVIAGTCRGIQHKYGGYGRLHVRNVRAQCLKGLIEIDTTMDDCRIENVGQGNIWCFHPEVTKYTLANLVTFALYRTDNPWLDNLFSIGHFRALAIYQNSDGTTSKAKLSNADFDLGATAIYIGPSCIGATMQITGLAAQGPDDTSVTAGSLIEDHGTNSRIQIEGGALSRAIQNAIRVDGSGSVITCDSLRVDGWDRYTGGNPAFYVGGGNTMILDGRLTIEGSGTTVWSISASATVLYADGGKSGTAALGASATSVTVSHGQITTPTAGQVRAGFAGNPYSSSKVWITSITATQMTINVDVAPGTATSLWWEADCSRV